MNPTDVEAALHVPYVLTMYLSICVTHWPTRLSFGPIQNKEFASREGTTNVRKVHPTTPVMEAK